MRDITEMMGAYRECSRNLWNVYFSKRADIGESLDAFGQIRHLLFESLVVNQLFYEGDEEGEEIPPPMLKVVPHARSLILIGRPNDAGGAGYWDQERDLVVSPSEIELEFLDYFDFAQIPLMDFQYYRCKVLRFPNRVQYEGREALIEAVGGSVFHDE